VAEFGRREDALKQKEKELQNIKDRENQEEMDSLTFRELSFSSKHANDADKLIKWHQELEQSSQEIHTQHARLDEDRFKIEEQLLKR